MSPLRKRKAKHYNDFMLWLDVAKFDGSELYPSDLYDEHQGGIPYAFWFLILEQAVALGSQEGVSK